MVWTKRRNRFLRQIIGSSLVTAAILVVGCTGTAEEAATIQAVAEQLVSTDTPTPLPPPTATPTPSPVPPTATVPPPPTDTPFPPTNTPVPPTPTRPVLVSIADPDGDAFDCGTQATVADSEVDLTLIQLFGLENALQATVTLKTPLESDYSFAVLLAVGAGTDLSAYIWEIHDTVNRIGQLDLQTGELVAEPAAGLLINHDLTLGEVNYTIPITGTLRSSLVVTTTTQTNQMFISSFHTPEEGESKRCDNAGPFTFTYGAQTEP